MAVESETQSAAEDFSPVELALATRNHGLPLESLRYDLTPVGLHYLLIHFDIPQVDAATWRLEIGGEVRSAAFALARRAQGAPAGQPRLHARVRRQRPRPALTPSAEPAVARGGGRQRRVDGNAARAAARGGRRRRRRSRGALHRPRPRHPGRARARLRAQPSARRGAPARAAPRLRDQRAAASAPARLPAPADRARLVRHDAREVARADHRPQRAVRGLPAGAPVPGEAVGGRPRHPDHEDAASLAAHPARDSRLPRPAAVPRAGAVPARRPGLVRPRADHAGRGERRRRAHLGGRGARRADRRVRLAPVDVLLGRRRARRVRALLDGQRTARATSSRPSRAGTTAATSTTPCSASPSPSAPSRAGRFG